MARFQPRLTPFSICAGPTACRLLIGPHVHLASSSAQSLAASDRDPHPRTIPGLLVCCVNQGVP